MTRTAALALWTTVMAVGCAGAAVLVACTGSTASRPVDAIDPGAPTRLADSSAAGPASVAPTVTPTGPASARSSAPSASPPSATSSVVASPGPMGAPVRLQLPAIDVTAPVRPVGVDARGEVAIPERVDTVGWYRYSALPGSPAGSTVLVGHVDSATAGEGAFFRLRDLGRGDRIVVDLAGGRRLTYRVVSRAQFAKTSVPLGDLFSLGGRPRLTLITCGGSFDAAARSYRDNVVITAVPR